jgi:hypothetical protein
MHRLILSLLMFSVNSLPQDLYGRFLEASGSSSALPYSLQEPAWDSSSSALTDGSPDLFSSAPDLTGGRRLNGADDLGETSLFSTVDGVRTSSDPSNPSFAIAALPENPTTHPDYSCPAETALACCFLNRLHECIWYHENDPGCYYESDFRCCKDIDGVIGKECKEATRAQSNPIVETILGVLRTEVEAPDWITPLVGTAKEVWNGL